MCAVGDRALCSLSMTKVFRPVAIASVAHYSHGHHISLVVAVGSVQGVFVMVDCTKCCQPFRVSSSKAVTTFTATVWFASAFMGDGLVFAHDKCGLVCRSVKKCSRCSTRTVRVPSTLVSSCPHSKQWTGPPPKGRDNASL